MTVKKIYQPLVGLMAERLEWQTRALCRYEDPEIFFPNQRQQRRHPRQSQPRRLRGVGWHLRRRTRHLGRAA